jgi:flagellar hook assembly protein FlgD
LGAITTGLDKVQRSANSQILINYPNPFNQKTAIQFEISNKQPVQLKVYDIVGNEVSTLVNEEKATGKYEVNFDGSNIPEGIYIVKIQAGNSLTTRKMIVKR